MKICLPAAESVQYDWEAVPDATVQWRIVDDKGALNASGQWMISIGEDSVAKLGLAEWTANGAGHHQLRAEVNHAGRVISENIFEFEVTE